MKTGLSMGNLRNEREVDDNLALDVRRKSKRETVSSIRNKVKAKKDGELDDLIDQK